MVQLNHQPPTRKKRHNPGPAHRIPGLWRDGVELIPAFVDQVPPTITILGRKKGPVVYICTE